MHGPLGKGGQWILGMEVAINVRQVFEIHVEEAWNII